jgi:hypothetical protein
MRWMMLGVGIGLAALAGCGTSLPKSTNPPAGNQNANDNAEAGSNLFNLRVARHEREVFTEADVDAVFSEASRLLQTVQTECPDVATDVTFARADTIETFNDVPDVITTDAQLEDALALPQDFKIIHAMVGVCGVDIPSDVATIVGCATSGGSVVIVSEAPADVWAHEWGHVLGLDHRDDCARNIMHSYELDTNAVNNTEHNAFLGPAPGARRLKAIAPTAAEPESGCATSAAADVSLEELIGRRYPAGIPADLAGRIDFAATARLRTWCADAASATVRRNANRIVGLRGDAGACDLLMRQIVEPVGELTRDEFDAVAEALLALGRLVNRDPSGAALGFLTEGSDPQAWARRGIAWSFAGGDSEATNRILARLSILALGLAQNDAALTHLHGLRAQIDCGTLAAEDFADQVDEAIARCDGSAAWRARTGPRQYR